MLNQKANSGQQLDMFYEMDVLDLRKDMIEYMSNFTPDTTSTDLLHVANLYKWLADLDE